MGRRERENHALSRFQKNAEDGGELESIYIKFNKGGDNPGLAPRVPLDKHAFR